MGDEPKDPTPTHSELDQLITELAEELPQNEDILKWLIACIHQHADEIRESGVGTDGRRGANARQVCVRILQKLDEVYNGDVERGLACCRITCSEDIGRIVFGFVRKGLLNAEEGDQEDDFLGIFTRGNLGTFMVDSGIRLRTSWMRHHGPQLLCVLGVVFVTAGYINIIPYMLGQTGIIIFGVGLALLYYPARKTKGCHPIGEP